MLAAVAREVVEAGQPVPRPACVLLGGETTVTLRGDGRGGRNQELALSAALALARAGITSQEVGVLAAGTDGTDGPTEAAGAMVTGATLAGRGAQAALLDGAAVQEAQAALARNDSYGFFSKRGCGALLVTGPTGTNVMDVMAVLVR